MFAILASECGPVCPQWVQGAAPGAPKGPLLGCRPSQARPSLGSCGDLLKGAEAEGRRPLLRSHGARDIEARLALPLTAAPLL